MSPQALQVLFVVGMVPAALLALLRSRFAVDTDRSGVALGVANGVLATFGMLAFYAALARGKVSVVGPLTSLFPLFTVAGAVLILRERFNRVQACGIMVALAAVALLSR